MPKGNLKRWNRWVLYKISLLTSGRKYRGGISGQRERTGSGIKQLFKMVGRITMWVPHSR